MVATGVLVICIAPFAAARTGDPLREGVRNDTTTAETQIISNVGPTTTTTGGYSTHQSNLSSTGGGAVYDCRSQAGGSARRRGRRTRASARTTSRPASPSSSTLPTASLPASSRSARAATPRSRSARTRPASRLAGTPNASTARALRTSPRTGRGIAGAEAVRAGHRRRDGAADARCGSQRRDPSPGTYSVVFTGDLSSCALQATITGGAPGMITVTPTVAADRATTTVDPGTWNGNNIEADRGFHLSANC